MSKLLWVDLETTGLDPFHDDILEIAVVESEFSDPFGPWEFIIDTPVKLTPRELVPYIQAMHTANGLLADCMANGETVTRAEDVILARMSPGTPLIAGSSVHFDLAFLRVHMPRLAARLHYRTYDVRSIELFCQSLGMPELEKGDAHRAMADVEASIERGAICAAWVLK